MESEDWKERKEHFKALKQQRQLSNTEIVMHLSGEFDFKVEEIQPYQLRMHLLIGKVDYYPQSGKATIVGSNKWFRISNIENYLNELYPF